MGLCSGFETKQNTKRLVAKERERERKWDHLLEGEKLIVLGKSCCCCLLRIVCTHAFNQRSFYHAYYVSVQNALFFSLFWVPCNACPQATKHLLHKSQFPIHLASSYTERREEWADERLECTYVCLCTLHVKQQHIHNGEGNVTHPRTRYWSK